IQLALPVGGRVNDPRFDFTEVIWSTLRNAAVNAITAPVSWIGRVRFSDDSRIQRIEVDPIQFEPGTAKPTPEGQEQVTRLVAFLDQTPETRLTATAVVSRRDLAALKQPGLDKRIERVARAAKIPPDAAGGRAQPNPCDGCRVTRPRRSRLPGDDADSQESSRTRRHCLRHHGALRGCVGRSVGGPPDRIRGQGASVRGP